MFCSLLTRVKSFFLHEKYSFWWNQITNEEKALVSLDVWQLAAVIHVSIECNNNVQKRIVAEHLLNIRLAKIQANASKWSAWLGAAVALMAVMLTFYLSKLSAYNPTEVVCTCNCRNEQYPKEKQYQLPNSRQFSHGLTKRRELA